MKNAPITVEAHNRSIGMVSSILMQGSGDYGPQETEAESLLRESIAHLRITMGYETMTLDERKEVRADIREFIAKVEKRS